MSLHHWRRANLSASTDVQHRPQMYAFNGGRFLWGMIRWVQCLLKTSQSKQKQAGVMVERELRIISGPTQWCWSVIWPLFSVMSNLTRKYLQTSDQIKVNCITIIFVIFLRNNIYFCFLLASQGVMSCTGQVTFSAWGQLVCYTTQTTMEGGERCAFS